MVVKEKGVLEVYPKNKGKKDNKQDNAIFLNLPHKEKVMRRYMCSYYSPTFLFQPIELLSLAAIAKEKNIKPFLIDAIAEEKQFEDIEPEIKNINPSFIVCISGFECFEDDVNEILKIKQKFKDTPIILFGHYATVFHKEIMEKAPAIDYIIHGEPDLIFKELLAFFSKQIEVKYISGLSYRVERQIVHQTGHSRITNPNELPMPAFELLKNEYYGEPFFQKPYGLIQSARGCPYACNFCVKSFGTKLTALSPEKIVEQVKKYIELFNIKSFRFIDDTFTATPGRVIKFCKLLLEEDIHLNWSCLARPDTLNDQMLEWMKKAGCVRLYIGIESGSQKVLDFYNKNIEVSPALAKVKKAEKLGFELMGFFMVGAPNETKEDVKKSINFAINAGFEFIVVSKLMPYPGTPLYEELKEGVSFSIIPYENVFKDSSIEKRAYDFQRYFMRRFYFSPKVIRKIIRNRFKFAFSELASNSTSFLKYLFSSSKKQKRKDYI